MKLIIMFLLGSFAFSTISSDDFKTLETLEEGQLYLDITQEFDDVDQVSSVSLVHDEEGIFLYDIKGLKDGNPVSFKVEVDEEDALKQKLSPCSCDANYKEPSWVNYRWKCNLWCW